MKRRPRYRSASLRRDMIIRFSTVACNALHAERSNVRAQHSPAVQASVKIENRLITTSAPPEVVGAA
eukprot:scaffold38060_cov20-Prasinocladus_malaysianus.AAC.1